MKTIGSLKTNEKGTKKSVHAQMLTSQPEFVRKQTDRLSGRDSTWKVKHHFPGSCSLFSPKIWHSVWGCPTQSFGQSSAWSFAAAPYRPPRKLTIQRLDFCTATTLHFTLLHCTLFHRTLLHCTLLHCTLLHCQYTTMHTHSSLPIETST